jgi:hypothetical protein
MKVEEGAFVAALHPGYGRGVMHSETFWDAKVVGRLSSSS